MPLESTRLYSWHLDEDILIQLDRQETVELKQDDYVLCLDHGWSTAGFRKSVRLNGTSNVHSTSNVYILESTQRDWGMDICRVETPSNSVIFPHIWNAPICWEQAVQIPHGRTSSSKGKKAKGGSSLRSITPTPIVRREVTLTLTILHHLKPSNVQEDLKKAENRLEIYFKTFNCPLHSDIVFTFPYEHGTLKVYASRTLLGEFSDHFKTMFSASAGFSESELVDAVNAFDGKATDGNGTTTLMQVDEDDSDYERDQAILKSWTPPREFHPLKTIPIKQTCYSTYRALISYLYTGKIKFASLKSLKVAREYCPIKRPRFSTPLSSNEDGANYDCEYINPVQPASSSIGDLDALETFYEASPKSIYRLAHLYNMPELADLALENIMTQITVDNVMLELTSSFSASYPAVRPFQIQFLIRNFNSVKESPVNDYIQKNCGVIVYDLFLEAMAAALD